MRLAPSIALLLAVLALGAARPAAAQAEVEFVWVSAPLSEALYELAEATGLELVFALRLVEDVRVSGRYRASDDPDRALRYLLRGTGVRAERIREGQYVLIKEPLNLRPDIETTREAYTGTLDGRVVDAETNVPLMGAHVWLVDIGLGDVVTYDGAFAVPDLPTGRYVVRVSHVGYRPVRLELDVFPDSPRLPPTIRLQAEVIETPDTPVVAGPDPPGPTPGMTELTPRETTQQAAAIPYALGEADLAATLSWLPGLTRTGGASGALVVRGADPAQTLTIRDGVPLYEPWHAFGLFSAFQPEALSRVRFHRGSLPAPLGGGLAAVLDVETTSALAGDTLRTLGLGAVAARAVADVPLGDRVGVHLGLRRSVLGSLLAPGLRAEGGAWVLDPTGGRPFQRGGADPSVAFGDATVKLSAAVAPTAHIDLSATLGTDRVRVDLPGQRGRLDYGWRTHTASARYQGLQGQTTLLTALAYRTGHTSSEDRAFQRGLAQTDQVLVEHGVTLDIDRFVSLAHQVRAGVQVAHREVTGTLADGMREEAGQQRVAEAALYLMDTWRPGEGWQLQPGLRAEARVDDGRVLGLDLSPRLFARWSPDADRLVVRGGVSRQTQAVQRVRDRTEGRYALAASRWLLTDRQVPLARAWQLGAGAEWAPSDPLAFSLDLYGRRSTGLLEPILGADREAGVDPADLLATHPPHDGRGAGVELAARLNRGEWTLGFSGALSRTEVRPETGGAWRASSYDRPVTLGLLAQRNRGPWTAALRLDVESGLPREGGGRDVPQVRASGALGAHATLLGLRWTALAQATARPSTPSASAGVGDAGLPLAADPRGLPGWPILSLSARW